LQVAKGRKGIACYYYYHFRLYYHGNAVQAVAGSCQDANAGCNDITLFCRQDLRMGKKMIVAAVIRMGMGIDNAVDLLRLYAKLCQCLADRLFFPPLAAVHYNSLPPAHYQSH